MTILYRMYDDFIEGIEYINAQKIDKKVIKKTNGETIDIPGDLQKENNFIPNKIKEYMITNVLQKVTYKFNIRKKEVVLSFYIYKTSDVKYLDNYYRTVGILVFMINLYAQKKCTKFLEIDIFLTDFKRKLPKRKADALGADNVNGGYSFCGCLEKSALTIYRKEDWIKVLIHELFHNFDLDFSAMDITAAREKAQEFFKLKSKYNIFETYCETWARIIYIGFMAFTHTYNPFSSKHSKLKFVTIFTELIRTERDFSLYQANKVQQRIDNMTEYSEESNVFCYYILTAALLYNHSNFISWCYKYNDNILRFKKTQRNILLFLNFVIKEYENPAFQTELSSPPDFAEKTTMRMSY